MHTSVTRRKACRDRKSLWRHIAHSSSVATEIAGPHVMTRFRLRLSDQGRDKGFPIATESLWPCVTIVDRVAIGCGQWGKALCCDMEIVSRQRGATGSHQRAWQRARQA